MWRQGESLMGGYHDYSSAPEPGVLSIPPTCWPSQLVEGLLSLGCTMDAPLLWRLLMENDRQPLAAYVYHTYLREQLTANECTHFFEMLFPVPNRYMPWKFGVSDPRPYTLHEHYYSRYIYCLAVLRYCRLYLGKSLPILCCLIMIDK